MLFCSRHFWGYIESLQRRGPTSLIPRHTVRRGMFITELCVQSLLPFWYSLSVFYWIIYSKHRVGMHITDLPGISLGLLSAFLNPTVFRLRIYSWVLIDSPSSSELWVTDADTSALNGWRTVWVPRDIDPFGVYWVLQGIMELSEGVWGVLPLTLALSSLMFILHLTQ